MKTRHIAFTAVIAAAALFVAPTANTSTGMVMAIMIITAGSALVSLADRRLVLLRSRMPTRPVSGTNGKS